MAVLSTYSNANPSLKGSNSAFPYAVFTSFSALNSTGKETDCETGYFYFGARYYDPTLLTSWTAVDPMSDDYPNMSPYHYCHWNPMRLTDPTGRCDDEWTCELTTGEWQKMGEIGGKEKNYYTFMFNGKPIGTPIEATYSEDPSKNSSATIACYRFGVYSGNTLCKGEIGDYSVTIGDNLFEGDWAKFDQRIWTPEFSMGTDIVSGALLEGGFCLDPTIGYEPISIKEAINSGSKMMRCTRILGTAAGGLSLFSSYHNISEGVSLGNAGQQWRGVIQAAAGISSLISAFCPVTAPICGPLALTLSATDLIFGEALEYGW